MGHETAQKLDEALEQKALPSAFANWPRQMAPCFRLPNEGLAADSDEAIDFSRLWLLGRD